VTGSGTALARAREHFLGDGALGREDVVRPEIVDSWERSRRAGVDACRLTVPFEADLDVGSSLMACAAPVLDHLEEQLSGSAVSVVLTDADGRLLDRRVGVGELRHRLDDISLAPGFSYAEEFAGTNGVGTALRGGAATLVVGAEHFTERLQPFACAGAPVLHPVTGVVLGLVDVTCMRAEANDLMRVLALQAARDIALVLRERGGMGARTVMGEFQAVCARSPRPVLAVSEDFLIANRRAQTLLGGADQELLRRRAGEWMRGRTAFVQRVVLTCGPVRVRHTPVVRSGQPVGVVLEVLPDDRPGTTSARTSGRGLPGLAGSSASWRSSCAALRDAAARGATTVVLGERGTGKETAIRAVHGEVRPAARWMVVEAGEGSPGSRTTRDALEAMDRADPRDLTLVVRHLEDLDTQGAEALDALVHRARASGCWMVGLVTGSVDPERPVAGVVASFDATVTVAPLRHRADDIPGLVDALLERLAPSRRVRCLPAARALLAGARWPGNVSELVEVLRGALAAKPVGDIEPSDLPSELVAHGTRRRLSPLETLERDLIVTTLEEAGGNRVRAAAALGMGRATLYRRLRAFGLTDVGR